MAEKAIIVNTPKNKIQSDAQDWASIFNSIIGDQSGVLTYGEKLKLTKKNNNTVTLYDGVYSMQGHMIQVERGSTVDLIVDSGTLGVERVDSVVVEYVKNGDRTENDNFEFKVVKGEPQVTGGNAVAPTLLNEDLLSGGLTRQDKLFDLSINGTELSIVDERKMIESMKEFDDRVASEFNANKITSGSNATGSWTKFPDGTMICRYKLNTAVDPNTREDKTWIFPQPFLDTPVITPTMGGVSYQQASELSVFNRDSTNKTRAILTLANEFSLRRSVDLDLIAIGMWK